MHKRIIIALAVAALVSACDVVPSKDVRATTVTPETNEPAALQDRTAANTLEGALRKGMAYVDLRNAALAEGWLPLVDPKCKENVGGEASICNQLAELESCSSDGHCLMRFAHGSDQGVLSVNAYGDYTKWPLSGESAVLNVRGWEFSTAASAVAVPKCPSQNFSDFLDAFAGDDSLQRTFTLPLVNGSAVPGCWRGLGDVSDLHERCGLFRVPHRSRCRRFPYRR